MFQISAYADRHVGRKRSNNEDFVTYFEPEKPEVLQKSGRLYVLCDGVGGASFGEKASKFAAQSVLHDYYEQTELEPGERLRMLVRKAGNQINQFANDSEHFMRMATTLVAAVVLGDQLIVANVGDSRAYLLRDGKAQQITVDHSYVDEMVRSGQMTPEEAARSNAKNRITRSLGGERDVRVDIFRLQLLAGDRILLCSDGLTRYAEPQDIYRLSQAGAPEAVVKNLIDYANHKGGVDNISVAYIAVDAPGAAVTVPRKHAGVIPQSVDWETISTDPGEDKKLFTKTQIIVLTVLSTLLLVVLIFLALIRFTNLVEKLIPNNEIIPPVTEQVEIATMTETASLLREVSTKTPLPVPSQTSSITSLPTEILIKTLFPTQTPEPSATEKNKDDNNGNNPNNPDLPDPDELINCSYEVTNEDSGLFEILQKLELPQTSEFTSLITCVSENCTFDFNNINYIKVGWMLVFPDVPRRVCKEAGGVEIIEEANGN